MPRSRSAPPDSRRQASWRWGIKAERRAALFLRLKGYRILARRVRTPGGEIDVVALSRRTLVFVEVKARAVSEQHTEALEAVNERRIANAAQYYLARHPRLAGLDIRFDVIFLAPFAWPRHVIDAFGG